MVEMIDLHLYFFFFFFKSLFALLDGYTVSTVCRLYNCQKG